MTRAAHLGNRARLRDACRRPTTRRRLTFVGACAPGVVMMVLGPELSQDPRWLGAGLVLLLTVVAAGRISERRFRAWDICVAVPPPPSKEFSHDRCS